MPTKKDNPLKPRIYYKRALEQLAPLVGGLDLLDFDPWLVIDNAREEIVALRAEVKLLRK